MSRARALFSVVRMVPVPLTLALVALLEETGRR